MIITLDKYLTSNGRHNNVITEWSGEYEKNALKTIALVSEFASLAKYEIPDVTSGWRPSWLNRNVGGSTSSKHLFAQAIDVADPDHVFNKWLCANVSLLRSRGCAIESPVATPSWTHFQIIVPPSGSIIFNPR
jgi:ABC-type proline/glycine betaine transport system substrate-binding protein